MIKRMVKCMFCLAMLVGLVAGVKATDNLGELVRSQSASVQKRSVSLAEWMKDHNIGMGSIRVIVESDQEDADPPLNLLDCRISDIGSITIAGGVAHFLDFSEFSSLKNVEIYSSFFLKKCVFPTEHLEGVKLSRTLNLKEIENLENCANLRSLSVEECNALKDIIIPSRTKYISIHGHVPNIMVIRSSGDD